jgi:hypothetical protein
MLAFTNPWDEQSRVLHAELSQAAVAIPVALILFVLFLKASAQTQGHSQPLELQAVMYGTGRHFFGERRNFGPGAGECRTDSTGWESRERAGGQLQRIEGKGVAVM